MIDSSLLPSQATIVKNSDLTSSAGGNNLLAQRTILETGEVGTTTQSQETHWYWLGSVKYTVDYKWTRSYTEYDNYSLNASQPITIGFLGNTGTNSSNKGSISIQSKGSVELAGDIRSQAYAGSNALSSVSIAAGVNGTAGDIFASTTGISPSIYSNLSLIHI